MRRRLSAELLALLVLLPAGPAFAGRARLKELAAVQGVRENQLFGYGLVMGLSGTGDTERVFFTSQSLSGMLGRLGIRVDARDVRSRNVAAVMVTARVPTYARPGTQIDVQVSSLGDARSLAGGVLVLTPLAGADGTVYAVSQGAVQVGGYSIAAAGSTAQKNQVTTGRVPAGATVEKAVAPVMAGPLVLGLKRPDFSTARHMAEAIDAALGKGSARAVDLASVEVTSPPEFKDDTVGLMAKLESLEVEADQRARVVINERTGTVVAGEHVRIRPVVVAHGGLQVSVSQRPIVSQPVAPFSNSGQTIVAPVADVAVGEGSRTAVALPATSSVEDLVKALNLLGATPRDMISIFQALDAAGALDAELEVL